MICKKWYNGGFDILPQKRDIMQILHDYLHAIQSISESDKEHTHRSALENLFKAIEFLIAPYTIAHLKISQSFKEEFNAPLNDNEKLNILLTNTIYAKSAKDERNEKSNLFAGMYELAQEFLNAQNLKERQILIITGNPHTAEQVQTKGYMKMKSKSLMD